MKERGNSSIILARNNIILTIQLLVPDKRINRNKSIVLAIVAMENFETAKEERLRRYRELLTLCAPMVILELMP